MVAYRIWMQAAQELPKCPEESRVADFVNEWMDRTYTDVFSTKSVVKHFGLSRATTLLDFVTGGRYSILDARVRKAIARLLPQQKLGFTVKAYMDSCVPILRELADRCGAVDFRMLDKALFSYGTLDERAFSMAVLP